MIRWLLFDEARYEEPGLTNPYANRPSYARFGTLLASTIWARSTVGVVMAVLGAASVKMNARFEQRSQGMADQELLLADLQHFSESLWRNEEVGEKRFNFFVTLVTAASAGLVTLYASQHAPTGTVLEQIRNGVLIALAGFGTLTYLRMLQRNRVTDEYKRTLTYIRKRLVAIDRSMRNYRVPQRDKRGLFRGGLAETVGAVNAIILCVLAFVMESPLPAYIPTIDAPAGAVMFGVLALVVFWVPTCLRHEGTSDIFPDEYFRAGVGAVIFNCEGLVLSLERADLKEPVWQFPQGGLGDGEKPEKAVFREIFEETAIKRGSLEKVEEFPEPLVYELPASNYSVKTGRGQVQYWFLFRLKHPWAEVQIDNDEFRTSAWRPFSDVVAEVVSFRRHVYQRLEQEWRVRIANTSRF